MRRFASFDGPLTPTGNRPEQCNRKPRRSRLFLGWARRVSNLRLSRMKNEEPADPNAESEP